MQQAKHSEGFEVRMNVYVIAANGHRAPPIKVALIGQFNGEQQRLLWRGIAPDNIRNQYIAAERDATGHIRAIRYTGAAPEHKSNVNPQSAIFGSGLVLWDTFTPWWAWPTQGKIEATKIGKHECELIRSQPEETAGGTIKEVESCVDIAARISWQTRLLDADHALIRSITVGSIMRKNSGGAAAKKLSITEANKTVTKIEIYSGDEQYEITPETFSSLAR
jgi:hypothetical protein